MIEQKVDALLWKHTKEQPVAVDFRASGVALKAFGPRFDAQGGG